MEDLHELENCHTVDQRKFWSLINRRRHQHAQKVRPTVSHGEILTDPEEIREGWHVTLRFIYTTGGEVR